MHRCRELGLIDGPVGRLMTGHARRFRRAGLSQSGEHPPKCDDEETHNQTSGGHGPAFGPGGLEPGTLSSARTLENLREATKPTPASAPTASPTMPVAIGLMVPSGAFIGGYISGGAAGV